MAETITIETARGPATVDAKPETIAVFDIPAVDTLNALGITVNGTVDEVFVDYLDEVSQSAKVTGSLFEPDYKALSMMKPDLIIVGGRSSTTLDKVSKVAPAVDMTITGDALMEQSRQRINTYGELFGKQDKAKELVSELDDALAQAKAAAKGKGNGLILMTNGPKVSAFGTGSRFGWIYSALDLKAATSDISIANHGDAVSFEFVLKVDPDWILVIDRSSAIGAKDESPTQTLDNEIIHQTKAWKNNQLVYLNSADIYIASGGIQSQLRTLALLSKAFNAAQ
ncbi:siderophore ABC transporter substrate-binding protein [Leucothrix mucor]|uniref:siderophore ABC transporter substrate-binding protein n=1 Tax=Leucothrix mucor TaxID=45248 RepID=UPI0003B42829|nr:siderophore ABC transporter substrate-binding protein [Leucothrix mucor]